MRRLLALMLVSGALACGGSSPAAPVTSLDGTWNGSTGAYQVSLGLTQSDTVVTGTGLMAGNTGIVQLDVTGSFHAPNFTLTLSAPQFPDVVYTGQLSSTTPQMIGQLNGSGFTQTALTVTRK